MGTFTLALLIPNIVFAQLTLEAAREKTVSMYHLGASTYFDGFVGHPGYGAIVILTKDGGAAAFGDGDEGLVLLKLDQGGTEKFKRKISRKGDEIEAQAVAEDKAANLYVFMLVYDHTKYRGGNERVVCFNKAGTLLWDKYLGVFSAINNPIVSWIRTADNGSLSLRGHIAPVRPVKGADPEYRFWEASLTSKGVVTKTVGDAIDWGKPEWQKKFQPEN